MKIVKYFVKWCFVFIGFFLCMDALVPRSIPVGIGFHIGQFVVGLMFVVLPLVFLREKKQKSS